jgi:hypothetical protein
MNSERLPLINSELLGKPWFIFSVVFHVVIIKDPFGLCGMVFKLLHRMFGFWFYQRKQVIESKRVWNMAKVRILALIAHSQPLIHSTAIKNIITGEYVCCLIIIQFTMKQSRHYNYNFKLKRKGAG